VLVWDMKQVLDIVSQQLAPPFVAAGQLFWQSVSAEQLPGHAVPPPFEEPLPPEELPPLDAPL